MCWQDVILVYALFLDVFAILGVQLFAGKFGSCDGEASDGARGGLMALESLSGPRLAAGMDAAGLLTRSECEAAGREWINPSFGHFDNIASAALLLFEMASLEGWTTVMFVGIDARGVELAPVRDHGT